MVYGMKRVNTIFDWSQISERRKNHRWSFEVRLLFKFCYFLLHMNGNHEKDSHINMKSVSTCRVHFQETIQSIIFRIRWEHVRDVCHAFDDDNMPIKINDGTAYSQFTWKKFPLYAIASYIHCAVKKFVQCQIFHSPDESVTK